jgi:CheY-like chemotaxis protein
MKKNGHWNYVLKLVNGNTEKANEIVKLFNKETPLAITQIKTFLMNGQREQAATLIHKIKSRFSYLGADEVTEEMTDWENRLKSEKTSEQDSEMALADKLDKITATMINELKEDTIEPVVLGSNSLLGKTVLVAEDDEINAMVFELFVKEVGGHVIKVVDGNQAVVATLEKKPDLIFMDVHMPFFSGLEAIRSIRSKGIQCPIISLSASTRLNEKQNSLDAGANDFLVKPAKRESINALLLKYLC